MNLNKRIFGDNVSARTRMTLKARQLLATRSGANADINYKYYPKDASTQQLIDALGGVVDPSSRTPFVRMWTALEVDYEDMRTFVKPGSMGTVNVAGHDIDLTSAYQEVLVDMGLINSSTGKLTQIYSVGNSTLNNASNYKSDSDIAKATQKNSNKGLDALASTAFGDQGKQIAAVANQVGKAMTAGSFNDVHRHKIFPDELNTYKDYGNQFLKPPAGITSISTQTKTVGGYAIGAIIESTINFVVHSFHDFDKIFSKYFMKPGARIFLDYGWDVADLYSPECLATPDIVSDEMDCGYDAETGFPGVEQLLWGDNGYITNSNGNMDTLVGTVTKWDSKITKDGTINCSITIVSENSALYGSAFEDDNVSKHTLIDELDKIVILSAFNLFSVKDGDPVVSRDLRRTKISAEDAIVGYDVATSSSIAYNEVEVDWDESEYITYTRPNPDRKWNPPAPEYDALKGGYHIWVSIPQITADRVWADRGFDKTPNAPSGANKNEVGNYWVKEFDNGDLSIVSQDQGYGFVVNQTEGYIGEPFLLNSGLNMTPAWVDMIDQDPLYMYFQNNIHAVNMSTKSTGVTYLDHNNNEVFDEGIDEIVAEEDLGEKTTQLDKYNRPLNSIGPTNLVFHRYVADGYWEGEETIQVRVPPAGQKYETVESQVNTQTFTPLIAEEATYSEEVTMRKSYNNITLFDIYNATTVSSRGQFVMKYARDYLNKAYLNFPYGVSIVTGVFYNLSTIGENYASKNIYVSWGRIEDQILNSNFGFGETSEQVLGLEAAENSIHATWNSASTICQWNKNLEWRQKSSDSLTDDLLFLYPFEWGSDLESVSSGDVEQLKFDGKMHHSGYEDNTTMEGVGNHSYDYLSRNGYGWNDLTESQLKKVIPIREIFIRLDVVKNAIKNHTNVRNAVSEILSTINKNSCNVFNWEISTDSITGNTLTIIDSNAGALVFEEEDEFYKQLFVFSPGSKSSIVKDYNLSFSTPSDRITTMLSIQALQNEAEITVFSEVYDQFLADKYEIDEASEKKLKLTYLPKIGSRTTKPEFHVPDSGLEYEHTFFDRQGIGGSLPDDTQIDINSNWSTFFTSPYTSLSNKAVGDSGFENDLGIETDYLGNTTMGLDASVGNIHPNQFGDSGPDGGLGGYGTLGDFYAKNTWGVGTNEKHVRGEYSKQVRDAAEINSKYDWTARDDFTNQTMDEANPGEFKKGYQFQSKNAANTNNSSPTSTKSNLTVKNSNNSSQIVNDQDYKPEPYKTVLYYNEDEIRDRTVKNKWEYFQRITMQNYYFNSHSTVLPYKLSLKIDGISNILPGNIFRCDFLPTRHRLQTYVQVMNVSNEVSPQGWNTTLDTVMRVRSSKKYKVTANHKQTDYVIDRQAIKKLGCKHIERILPHLDELKPYEGTVMYSQGAYTFTPLTSMDGLLNLTGTLPETHTLLIKGDKISVKDQAIIKEEEKLVEGFNAISIVEGNRYILVHYGKWWHVYPWGKGGKAPAHANQEEIAYAQSTGVTNVTIPTTDITKDPQGLFQNPSDNRSIYSWEYFWAEFRHSQRLLLGSDGDGSDITGLHEFGKYFHFDSSGYKELTSNRINPSKDKIDRTSGEKHMNEDSLFYTEQGKSTGRTYKGYKPHPNFKPSTLNAAKKTTLTPDHPLYNENIEYISTLKNEKVKNGWHLLEDDTSVLGNDGKMDVNLLPDIHLGGEPTLWNWDRTGTLGSQGFIYDEDD